LKHLKRTLTTCKARHVEELDNRVDGQIGVVRQLEAVLGNRPFFGSSEFGFLDVELVPFSAMFYEYEQH
jgi:glutathione S-transferase